MHAQQPVAPPHSDSRTSCVSLLSLQLTITECDVIDDKALKGLNSTGFNLLWICCKTNQQQIETSGVLPLRAAVKCGKIFDNTL